MSVFGKAIPVLRGGLTPIGLDVGSRRIKAVQLEGHGAGLRVAAAAMTPRAGDGATGSVLTAPEAAALADRLARAGFAGRRVVLAAPAAWVVQTVLELPARTAQVPVEQIARLELARAQRCDPSSFEMASWDLPAPHRAAKGTHLMAAGLSHAQADSLLDPLEAAGLDVLAVDITPSALARACAGVAAADGAITAVLDLGWDAGVLSLLYRGVVIYGRNLADAGLGQLHDAVGRRLDLDAAVTEYLLTEVGLGDGESGGGDEADLPDEGRGLLAAHADTIARELEASFAFATQQYPEAAVAKLLLVGGGAAIPGVAAHLSAALHIPAAAVAPTDLVTCDSSLLGPCGSPGLTAALGLAQFPEL